MEEIRSSFLQLPKSINQKELIWLVYRDLKPLSSISTDFDWSQNSLANKERFNLKDEKDFVDWLKEAGILYTLSQRNGNTIHLSKDPVLLSKNQELELNESVDAHTFRGISYGFGEENSKAYALAIQKTPTFPSDTIIHTIMVPEIISKDWYPYAAFLVRRNYELEDALPAQKWAEIIRSEVPQVAKDYETQVVKDLEIFREKLKDAYGY
jgi:hypothetical protein